jgi:hypothetical protein
MNVETSLSIASIIVNTIDFYFVLPQITQQTPSNTRRYIY